jgi:uncharacterized protein YjbI with pentapeptide repeats
MNILLIDDNIINNEKIINGINNNTKYILFNYNTDTLESIKIKINELNITNINSCGIIAHNKYLNYFKLVDSMNECYLNDILTWSDMKNFINFLKDTYSLLNFDFLACAIYSNTNWKNIIDTLQTELNININASTDNTGSSSLGGNWFLESHSGVNLKNVYFTDLIDEFHGLLLIGIINNLDITVKTIQIPTFNGTPTRPSRPSLPSIPSIPSFPSSLTLPVSNGGSLIAWGELTNGIPYSNVSSQLQSNVLYITTFGASGNAIKTDGSLVRWGRIRSETTTQFNTLVPNTASLSSGVVSVIYASDCAFALKNDGSIVGWGMLSSWPSYPSELSSGVVFAVSTMGDIACLKSNGSVRGWGMNVFSSSIPSTIYPSGANVNSNVVKLVGSNWPGAYGALKSDGSVAFFGNQYSNAMTNPTLFYPSESNITSGVVDILVSNFNFVALKNNGSVVVWGYNASTYNTELTGISATKIIQTSSERIIILKSNGTYLSIPAPPGNLAGSDTNIVDVIESGNNRLLFLKNDGTISYRGGESFFYNFDVDISVHTDVVKIFNMNYPYSGFNQNGMVLKSNGDLRNLSNVLIATNVNDVDAEGTVTNIYIKSDGSAGIYGIPAYTGSSSDLTSNIVYARSTYILKMIPPPTFSSWTISNKKLSDNSFTITPPTSNSNGAITYSSSNTNIATISGTTATIISSGLVTITATQASTTDFSLGTKTANFLILGESGNFTSVNFTGVDLSNNILTNSNLTNANLSGANITNVDFTNVNITGANITGINFTNKQKIQLLKNSNNRNINAIILSTLSGSEIVNSLPASTATFISDIPNYTSLTFSILTPPVGNVINIASNISQFIIPTADNERFTVNGTVYYSNGTNIIKQSDSSIVKNLIINNKNYRLLNGSTVGVVIDVNSYDINGVGFGSIFQQITDTPSFSNAVTITNNTNSSNATTGALIVTGGIGIGGNLYFNGEIYKNGSIFSGGSSQWTTTGNNIYYNSGNVYIGKTTGSFLLDVEGTGRVSTNNGSDGTFWVGGSKIQYISNLNTYKIGYQALNNTSGNNNIAIGTNALLNHTTTDSNIAIGNYSLNNLTIGAGNTVIGTNAQQILGISNHNYMITIGFNANCSAGGQVTLGDGNISTLRCNVQTITSLSDIRDKQNIQTLIFGIDFINKLNPVSFEWNRRLLFDKEKYRQNNDMSQKENDRLDELEKIAIQERDASSIRTSDGKPKVGMGFIAQEIIELEDSLNTRIPGLTSRCNPEKYEVSYTALIPIMVKAIKESNAQQQADKLRITQLENKISSLETVIDNIIIKIGGL